MRNLFILLILTSCFALSGCTGLIVAGAATGAAASQDRRTLPTQLEDSSIELKAIKVLFENEELWQDTNIDVVSYNNIILVLGQAPTAALKQKATDALKNIAKVSKVHNQIRIAAPISWIASRNDEFLTSKVKSSMLFTSDFPSSKIKVVTENSEVFLMGIVSQSEADKAVEIARNVGGVTKVIKVFEHYDETQQKE
jgi:osmotically-inducible protein OsmY